MLDSPWFPVVLLLAVAVYATWRVTVYFRRKQPAFGIALLFLILFCVYEAGIRVWVWIVDYLDSSEFG